MQQPAFGMQNSCLRDNVVLCFGHISYTLYSYQIICAALQKIFVYLV